MLVPGTAVVLPSVFVTPTSFCAVTVTQLEVTALKMFDAPLMLALVFVRFASGHVPVCPVTLVTFTEIVHVDADAVLAGTVVPETVIVVPLAGAEIDPPVQLFTIAGVAAICSLVGNVSMKLTTCAELLVGGLVIVNVKVVVPPGAIVVGLNALFRLVFERMVVVAVALLLFVLVSLSAATVAVLEMVPVLPAGTCSVTL